MVALEPNMPIRSRGRPATSSDSRVSTGCFSVGDAVADLPSERDSARAATAGAQVVDGLHLHAEVLDELARREHGLEAEPGAAFCVDGSWVPEDTPDETGRLALRP